MTDSLFDVEEFDSGSPPAGADPGPTDAVSQPASPTTSRPQTHSLYRKYRPQSFAPDELFGQEHIVNTLKNAIRLNRIGHAYLFCGPRGTGKTTTARILAKAVNCLDPDPANRPCNACDACNAINSNATTDVIEIDAASNRGIDDIRELRERVKYAPTMLNTKFYIIDEAHQITGAAANAFLKTLEEPPAHTRFVLATTDPEELLQTIVSRCQRFDFRRIDLEAMTACITRVASAERIEIEPDAVTTIARHATGSLRDALGLLDQVAVYRDEANADATQVTNELVRKVLGISRNDRVEGMVRAIAEQDAGAGLILINEAVESGEDARQLGRQFISYLRMLMLERASGSPDADTTARELAQRFELGRLARITSIFADVDYKSRHASVPQLPLELAIISACLGNEAREAPAGRSPQSAAQPEPDSRPIVTDTPTPPPPRKGPSLKDRVRGAPMPTSDASKEPARTISEPEPGGFDEGNASATAPKVPEAEVDTPPPASAETEPEEPARAAPAASSPPPPGGDPSLDRIVEHWDSIRMDVKALNRRTEALLQQADPLQVDGSNLTLVAAYPFHQKRLNDDDTRKTIESVVERLMGTHMTVTCISRDEAQQVRAQQSGSATGAASTAAAKPAPRESEPRKRPGAARDNHRPDDDDESEPASMPQTNGQHPHISDIPEPSASEHDDARIEAAINIFDAVLVEEDE